MEDIKKFLTGKKTDYVEIGGHRLPKISRSAKTLWF